MPSPKALLTFMALACLVAAEIGLLTAAGENVSADEEFLKGGGIPSDSASLAAYLRKQIVGESERPQLEKLVAQLGSGEFELREEAVKKLTAWGRPALKFLQSASKSADPEVSRRATACLTEIEKAGGSGYAAAAARLLVLRPSADAVTLLLDYYPHAAEPWVEDEVLGSLTALAIKNGKADPALLAALKDPVALRRAAAACALARAAGPDQRAALRQLLDDPDATVRQYIAHGLLGDRFPRAADSSETEDEKYLKNAQVAVDAAGLVAFFRKRTLFADDLQRMEKLVRQLGSDQFLEREEASRKLVEAGASVVAMLKEAMKSTDLEVVRRAEGCIEEVTRSPGPALPAAAARLLARRPAADAVKALLDFIPFADDAAVEEEVLTALGGLSARQAKLDDALLAALKDALPARRAAAAWVVGQVGDAGHLAQARSLLADPDPKVRFRAAQGLLAAKERAAVPALVALLGQGPADLAGQAEGLLQMLAADQGPTLSVAEGTALARQKAHEAWTAWWKDQGDKIDLAAAGRGARHMGLTIVAELIGTNPNGNRVWEFGLDGKMRWEMTNLAGPIDAHVLRGGRVLVAEHNASRVTERDLRGTIVWQKAVNGNPVACQRLPNGNTFIATYNHVMEVTPAGKEVYLHAPNPNGAVIYDATKLANGNIACITGQGTLVELDAAGKKVRTIQIATNGGWAGVSSLPGGRFLVALMSPGKVVEIDATGKVLWEAAVPHACHATRLPNGNTLVACMNTQRIVEVNPRGTIVQETKTSGRPFHVHRR